MSALQRLQEFRFKKMQETDAANQFKAPSTQRSNSSVSSSNGSASTSKEPETPASRSPDIEADPESESERDLRKAVKKMTTSVPLDRINGIKSTKPSQYSSLSSAQTSILSSSARSTLPFKKLVSSFRYSGEDAFSSPLPIDSDESLSSPGASGGDDVIMAESLIHNDSNKSGSHSPSKKIKRQIISSDEEEVKVVKPKRRLVRKGDLERIGTSEAPQKRRPVKRLALDSDEEFPRQASILISDDELDNLTTLDRKLAQLQTTFPDTPFDELKGALENSDGDFATAASKIISETSRQLLDLTSEPKFISSKAESSVQRKEIQLSKPTSEYSKANTFVQRKRIQSSKPPSEYSKAETSVQRKRNQLHKPPSGHGSLPHSSEEQEIEAISSSDDDSLDDEDGPNKYVAQDRKEERVSQFFNEASMVELQELTGCSKTQATLIIGLRPFGNYDQLCVMLRKTKGVGERIVNSYLTTTDAIRAVDMMLKTVERVREDLVGTLSVWCGDEENAKLFAASNTNSNGENAIKSEGNNSPEKGNDSDDNNSEPGVDLLDIDTEKVGLTQAGREAMKDFIRKQPSNMATGFQLKGYQLLGINWLALLWRKGLSGILADEMGLGKTAQVIAFLAHLREKEERARFLVIVPASTLSNWLREFEKFCPVLKVKSYYGSQAEREELRDELEEDPSYDVLVTTYTMATGNNSERKFLNRQRFQGVVLDEGHMLKNCMTARYKQLMSIKTNFRLLLTGTPLQNNLEELLSLLIFMMPKLFSEHEEVLRTMFKVKVDASSEKSTLLSQERIIRARHMIAPFVLRRKKIQVLKDLPRKTQQVIYCDLHPDQKVIYNKIMSSSALQAALQESSDYDKDVVQGKNKTTAKVAAASVKRQAGEFANILMQLRKAADHPMLFREQYKDETLKKMAKVITKEIEFCDSRIDFIEEDMSVMTDFELHRLCKQYKSVNRFALPGNQWMRAGKVQVLEGLLPKLVQKDKSRILIFSQFTMVLDILESIITTMDLKYLRMDGQTKVEERQPIIDTFNDDESYKVFLLSTKAGGFGINLTGANVVIMYDLDYNPHNDKQAEDRAHRVGQTRDVEVIKLISRDTIEEQIYLLASLKLKLDQHVSEDYSASSTSESSSSTPSAGILSLIKQNWKATLSAQATAGTSEEANQQDESPLTPSKSVKGEATETTETIKITNVSEVVKGKGSQSPTSSVSSLSSLSNNSS